VFLVVRKALKVSNLENLSRFCFYYPSSVGNLEETNDKVKGSISFILLGCNSKSSN
jgi:hypothetical protein